MPHHDDLCARWIDIMPPTMDEVPRQKWVRYVAVCFHRRGLRRDENLTLVRCLLTLHFTAHDR